jgi:plastocyanin
MRKALFLAVAVALIAGGSTALAGSAGVQVTDSGFTPATVSIQSGDSVNWTNNGSALHRIVVSGAPCAVALEPSQSASCTFSTPGTFSYSNAAGTFSGTINVAPSSRSVTLASSRNVGIFGDAMTLSGTVSSKAAGEHVSISAKPAGGTPSTYDVVTSAGGNWSLQVQPRARTTYQASWDTATSQALTVNLRPRLTFQKVGQHQYLVVVLGNRSFAGKRLDIARRSGGRYVTFTHATITRIARTSTTSVAYFRVLVAPGTHLRAFLPKSQAGVDYLDGHSNFVVQ